MKGTGGVKKWASGVLGVLCALLVTNLFLHFNRVRAGGLGLTVPSPGFSPPPLQKASQRSIDDLARYDPFLRLGLLKELQSRRLPPLSRNPFEFELPPAAGQPSGNTEVTPAPASPPPPPPIPLKALGYSEITGAGREAFVGDDRETYVVREGDTFAQKFRVLKITPSAIEIEDGSTGQTVRLAFPQ